MQEVDTGRYLDRTEVVNGRSIGDVVEMWERGELIDKAMHDRAVKALEMIREHGWSHASDPIKGWSVREKCPCHHRGDAVPEDGVYCNGSGIITRPATVGEVLTLFPRAYRTIARLIPWVLKETFTIGQGEIVSEEGEC